jgi:nickel-dependent lactate racemase
VALRQFTLNYGKETVSFALPEEQVLCEVVGRPHPAVDFETTYRHALDHPIDAPPLRELVRPGERVTIAVSDITRVWQRNDLSLPILLETLNAAGVPDENVTVVIAVGGHRLNTVDEHLEICGRDVCHRVKVLNHDAHDLANMVYLGRTSRGTEVRVSRLAMEADRLVLTGGTIYHYMSGYGGGRKSVLPGLSYIDTIRQNHVLGLCPEVGRGSNPQSASRITRGNALHEDMMEIAGFVQPDFLVNIVPTLDGGVAGVFAGNWASAWHEATRLVDRIFGAPIEAAADIVVASAGGYPRDINLYQTGKTMDNAGYAMRPGGAAIILSECSQVRDPETFFKWFGYPSNRHLDAALRECFHLDGWVALKQLECNAKGLFILVTRPENAEALKPTGFTIYASIEEALSIAYRQCGTPRPRITVMPRASLTLPILPESHA